MARAELADNREQAALWNGAAGKGWVAAGAWLDRMFAPFADLLVEEAAAAKARHVLDVGCGAGATTRALAAGLGEEGACLGVDISAPLIAAAKAKAAREESRARFLCADAAAHAFLPCGFDLLVSRFGVSFFAEPERAFAHLLGTARPGAGLRFLTWRSAAENPFLTAAERAAAPEIALPQQDPLAPGPFALADAERAARILAQSGWRAVRIEAVDRACVFPVEGLMAYLNWMGPVGRLLQTADGHRRARILDRVRPAFDCFVKDGLVRFTAACWMIAAEKSP